MIRIIIFFILIFLPLFAFANDNHQQASIRCFSVDNGLSSSLTYELAYGHDGYLWGATSNGLNRYDGYNFVTYSHDMEDNNSIGSNSMESVFIDNENNTWAGGISLSRFSDETQTFQHFAVSSGESIKTIIQDNSEQLWIGGNNFGLRKIDIKTGDIMHIYTHDKTDRNSLSHNSIYKIIVDNIGGLWIATEKGGLDYFDIKKETFINYSFVDIKKDQVYIFRDMLMDSVGQIWATSSDGLFMFNPKENTWKHYQHNSDNTDSLGTNDIWSVYEDRYNNIWIGTDKKGIDMFIPESEIFIHYSPDETNQTMPPGAVFNMVEDVNGALWISVFNFGICRFSTMDRKFDLFERNIKKGNNLKGLSFNNVLGLHEDSSGIIWIATDGGGLNRFDPEKNIFKHYKKQPNDKNSLSSDSVISISEDSEGILWLGTWGGGLNRFDPQKEIFTHYTTETSNGELLSNNIFGTMINSDGSIWLSVWDKGLQLFDPKSERFTDFRSNNINSSFKINNSHINLIYKSFNGNLWIGGHDGLERVNSQNKSVDYLKISKQNDIYDVYESKDGILWFATGDGLVKYNISTGNHIIFGKKQGLPDDYVTGIEVDNNGNFWLGTRHGLSKFNPETYVFENFGVNHGLQGLEFNRYSHLKTRDGVLYFGGTKGLNRFYPGKIPKNELAPTVLLTGFELFQKPVSIGPNSVLKKHIRYMDEIVLAYHQNDITFEFTALDFTAPEMNQYRYKLIGFDNEWIEVGSDRRRARYTNLSPGNYVFKVRASNNDRVWNVKGTSVDLRIIPPWWMTKLASLIAILIIISFIYLYTKLRFRKSMKRQKDLESQIKDKTLKLEEANLYLEERVKDRTVDLEKQIIMRREAEYRLFHTAMHDPLTDLPNRAWLFNKLKRLLNKFKNNNDNKFILIFLDGDQFKLINDSLGHSMGDKLIVAVGERLKKLLSDKMYLIHLGGDKLFILMDDVLDVGEGEKVADDILLSLKQPFYIDNQNLLYSVSMGIVMSSEYHRLPEEVIRDVDIAMYSAKTYGRACYRVFDMALYQKIQEDRQLVIDLKQALADKQFHLVYQPIINFENFELKGFEALIRWNHPVRGFISPEIFIPFAEDNGLIQDIGIWTLREACQQMANWSRKYKKIANADISVNLSAKQLAHIDFLDQVNEVLAETGVKPEQLKFEVTETSLMENTDIAKDLMEQMKDIGIQLAIDDFGTGHSSLSYLHEFPVHYLKIDRSFVSRIENNIDGMEIIKTIISLAKNLNMQTIAEGIETKEQLNLLKSHFCDFAQGYLIDKPLLPAEIEKRLKNDIGSFISF